MQVIRTAEELARLLATSLDPPVRGILEDHRGHLAEYADVPLEELAVFAICQPGDTLEALEQAIGRQPIPWEYVRAHGKWLEAVAILSDDGFGWVACLHRPSAHPSLLKNLKGTNHEHNI